MRRPGYRRGCHCGSTELPVGKSPIGKRHRHRYPTAPDQRYSNPTSRSPEQANADASSLRQPVGTGGSQPKTRSSSGTPPAPLPAERSMMPTSSTPAFFCINLASHQSFNHAIGCSSAYSQPRSPSFIGLHFQTRHYS
ncbi:hypothetical protein BKA56DRAFT_225106 [Ilyonectria sp. MPI-CAGE-AT-0026]|nr:hypothetical protein BKA56DRAFT_225106 [Ilyonectria sp. MPI-CAGE-AT-0026]